MSYIFSNNNGSAAEHYYYATPRQPQSSSPRRSRSESPIVVQETAELRTNTNNNDGSSSSNNSSNNNSNNNVCFLLNSPFQGFQQQRYNQQLNQRKENIAALATQLRKNSSSNSSSSGNLQIIDLEYSVEPLLLLELVEFWLRDCRDHHLNTNNDNKADFTCCSFVLRESFTNTKVVFFVGCGPTTSNNGRPTATSTSSSSTGTNETNDVDHLTAPVFEICINTDRNPTAAYRACLTGNQLRMAEAYLGGLLDVNGNLLACILCFQNLWSRHRTGFWNHKIFHPSVPLLSSIEPPTTDTTAAAAAAAAAFDRFGYALRVALDNDFDLLSPGIYMYEEEDMEPAAQRKLAQAYEHLQLQRGDTLLDVGCGWGGMMRFASNRGCHVTGITLSEHQAAYIQEQTNKVRSLDESITVLCQDLFTYKPLFNRTGTTTTATTSNARSTRNNGSNNIGLIGSNSERSTPSSRRQSDRTKFRSPLRSTTPLRSPPFIRSPPLERSVFSSSFVPLETSSSKHASPAVYDAISIMGALEELGTDYDKILSFLANILRPGGRIYLDFAAETATSAVFEIPFVTKHVFPSKSGSPSTKWVRLPRFLQAVEDSAFVVEQLWDNRQNYHLWAYKCYKKLQSQQDKFMQQLTQQQSGNNSTTTLDMESRFRYDETVGIKGGSRGRADDTSGTNPSTVSNTLFSLPDDVKDIKTTAEGEYLYKLLMSTFAGAASVMMQPDYHCTAYRMVLKLPEI